MTDIVLNAICTPGHSTLRIDYKIVLDGALVEIIVVKGVHANILETFND